MNKGGAPRHAALAALLALLTPACGATPAAFRARAGEAEARVTHYADTNGLAVTTLGARVEQPVSARSSVFARALTDHIVLTPRPIHAPHASPNQPTGHFDADVVTSASSTAGGAAGSDKWRYEGVLGGQVGFDAGKNPSAVRAFGRVSSEADYASYSGVVRFTTELAERNTTLSVFGGLGHDRVSPFEAPPGQGARWPKAHNRLLLGGSFAQILSPRLLLTLGVAATRQEGELSNPYRRAVVRTTLFPESVPTLRYRTTATLGLSWSVGAGSAVHLRQGAYGDSWGVLGVVSELLVAKEFGPRVLAALRYRFVGQTSASFYEVAYAALVPTMTGDARLGTLKEHEAALSLRWNFLGAPGDYGSLSFFGDQSVSRLHFERLLANPTILATVTSLGLILLY